MDVIHYHSLSIIYLWNNNIVPSAFIMILSTNGWLEVQLRAVSVLDFVPLFMQVAFSTWPIHILLAELCGGFPHCFVNICNHMGKAIDMATSHPSIILPLGSATLTWEAISAACLMCLQILLEQCGKGSSHTKQLP